MIFNNSKEVLSIMEENNVMWINLSKSSYGVICEVRNLLKDFKERYKVSRGDDPDSELPVEVKALIDEAIEKLGSLHYRLKDDITSVEEWQTNTGFVDNDPLRLVDTAILRASQVLLAIRFIQCTIESANHFKNISVGFIMDDFNDMLSTYGTESALRGIYEANTESEAETSI